MFPYLFPGGKNLLSNIFTVSGEVTLLSKEGGVIAPPRSEHRHKISLLEVGDCFSPLENLLPTKSLSNLDSICESDSSIKRHDASLDPLTLLVSFRTPEREKCERILFSRFPNNPLVTRWEESNEYYHQSFLQFSSTEELREARSFFQKGKFSDTKGFESFSPFLVCLTPTRFGVNQNSKKKVGVFCSEVSCYHLISKKLGRIEAAPVTGSPREIHFFLESENDLPSFLEVLKSTNSLCKAKGVRPLFLAWYSEPHALNLLGDHQQGPRHPTGQMNAHDILREGLHRYFSGFDLSVDRRDIRSFLTDLNFPKELIEKAHWVMCPNKRPILMVEAPSDPRFSIPSLTEKALGKLVMAPSSLPSPSTRFYPVYGGGRRIQTKTSPKPPSKVPSGIFSPLMGLSRAMAALTQSLIEESSAETPKAPQELSQQSIPQSTTPPIVNSPILPTMAASEASGNSASDLENVDPPNKRPQAVEKPTRKTNRKASLDNDNPTSDSSQESSPPEPKNKTRRAGKKKRREKSKSMREVGSDSDSILSTTSLRRSARRAAREGTSGTQSPIAPPPSQLSTEQVACLDPESPDSVINIDEESSDTLLSVSDNATSISESDFPPVPTQTSHKQLSKKANKAVGERARGKGKEREEEGTRERGERKEGERERE